MMDAEGSGVSLNPHIAIWWMGGINSEVFHPALSSLGTVFLAPAAPSFGEPVVYVSFRGEHIYVWSNPRRIRTKRGLQSQIYFRT